MTRYSFDQDDQRWHVGWDPAYASYFAQTEPLHPDTPRAAGSTVDPRDPRDVQVRSHLQREDELRDVVAGDRPGQVPTLAALTAQLHGQVVIPHPIREQLADDGPAHPERHAAAARDRLAAIQAMFPLPPTSRPVTPGTDTSRTPGPRAQQSRHRDQTPER